MNLELATGNRFADAGPRLIFIGLDSDFVTPNVMRGYHRHNEFELNFLLRGSVTYRYGGTVIKVPQGQMIFFWGAIPHQLISVEAGSELFWLTIPVPVVLGWNFPDAFVQDVLSGRMAMEGKQGEADRDAQNFTRWHKDIHSSEEIRLHVVRLEVQARLWRLAMHPLWMGGSNQEPTLSKPAQIEHRPVGPVERVEAMTGYIARHYTEPLTVAKVAKAVALHPNYAMKLFKEQCGLSLMNYATRLRVAHAQRLLGTTDESVLQIAFSSGFGSASRFYVVFQTECGCSPRAYRKATRSGGTERSRNNVR